jgi:hypothetical protein
MLSATNVLKTAGKDRAAAAGAPRATGGSSPTLAEVRIRG